MRLIPNLLFRKIKIRKMQKKILNYSFASFLAVKAWKMTGVELGAHVNVLTTKHLLQPKTKCVSFQTP